MSNVSEELIDLQTTIAYLETTVDELNKVVSQQDKQLQDLQRQMQLMFTYLQSSSSDGIAPFDLLADKPPHF